jgi:hypothetical protein
MPAPPSPAIRWCAGISRQSVLRLPHKLRGELGEPFSESVKPSLADAPITPTTGFAIPSCSKSLQIPMTTPDFLIVPRDPTWKKRYTVRSKLRVV